jgi:hypothetical protein
MQVVMVTALLKLLHVNYLCSMNLEKLVTITVRYEIGGVLFGIGHRVPGGGDCFNTLAGGSVIICLCRIFENSLGGASCI